MKKALTLGLITAGALLMSGCANKVPTYSNSAQNMRAVKTIAATATPVNIGKFTATNEGESKVMCRLATPVGTPDGMTFAKYIEDALATELEMGNMLDPKSKITVMGNLDSVYGSTMLGNAYWEFKVTVASNNGKSFTVNSRYDYESSYTAYSACSEMQRSYLPAVQQLINQIVTHPQFSQLLI